MHATVHTIDGIPGPHDTSWVDEVLTALRSGGVPAGALIAAPMGMGPGTVVALWDDERDAAAAPAGPAGSVTLGTGRAYEVDVRKAGVGPGPARYLQLITFDGPRDADWSAAYERAGEHRIWPAVRDVPGQIEFLGGTAGDGARFGATAAGSVEALEDMATAIRSARAAAGRGPGPADRSGRRHDPAAAARRPAGRRGPVGGRR